MNIMNWGLQNAMTNVINFHTCPAGRVYLLSSTIPVMEGKLLQFTGYVICGSWIHILVGVHSIGRRGRR